MKKLSATNFYSIVLIIVSVGFISCRNQLIDIIVFDASVITPGRVEQNKFTNYTLKFVNNEDSLISNSIKIIYDEIEITPIKFNQNSNSKYTKGDTVHLAFSIQNNFIADQSYTLVYNNNKKIKHKKLNQPQLIIKTNIPN